MRPMRFWLGTHEVGWLARARVPLFVSHVRLRKRKNLPHAVAPWALDSGAFSELAQNGRWTVSVAEYADAVHRYQDEVGMLAWAAPMDWMCEPFMVERTGLSVREHQERTVQNYLELDGLAIPVLQGWTLADYERCVDIYDRAGVDLASEAIVGLGSVCRRQNTTEVGRIVTMLAERGISAHGFGVKLTGVRSYGHLLASADSMAWSYDARRAAPLAECEHANCANCLRYALRWRDQVGRSLGQLRLDVGPAPSR